MCDSLFGGGNDVGSSKSQQQTTSTTTTSNTQVSTNNSQAPTYVGKTVTVTSTDAGIAKSALQGMADVVKDALARQSSANTSDLALLNQNAAQQAALVGSLLESNAQLSQNAQTGGATAAIKTTNYIVIGVIALAAILILSVFFKR